MRVRALQEAQERDSERRFRSFVGAWEPPTMPRPEPELLGDALRKADRDQEEVRKLTEQIREAIEGSEEDESTESY